MSRDIGGFYRPRFKDRHGEVKESTVIWWRYGHNGRKIRESTGAQTEAGAKKYARRRIVELSRGSLPAPDLNRVRFDKLVKLIEDDHRRRGLRSTARLDHALKHLRRFFDGVKAADISKGSAAAYADERKDQGAENSTVNRELSYLRRMLRLADQNGMLGRVPHIALLAEAEPRDVNLSEGEYAALIAALPEAHRGWVATCAITGWRKRAVLTRTWNDIRADTTGQKWLYLTRDRSKNKRSYRFPVVGDLADVLDAQRRFADEVITRTGRVTPEIFTFEYGKAIRFPDDAFKAAAAAIGRPELVIHDLRRFAVSRLVERSVSESDIMQLCGLRTRSIFDRYNVGSQERRIAAVERAAGLLAVKPDPKVVELGQRQGKDKAKSVKTA